MSNVIISIVAALVRGVKKVTARAMVKISRPVPIFKYE